VGLEANESAEPVGRTDRQQQALEMEGVAQAVCIAAFPQHQRDRVGVEVVLVYRSHLLGADRAVCNIYDTIQQVHRS